MRWSVLYDETFDAPEGLGEPIPIPRVGELGEQTTKALSADVVVVAGDDWTVSRVATVLGELRRGVPNAPRILPLKRGETVTLSDELDFTMRRGIRKLVRALQRDDLSTVHQASLRVVDAAQPHAHLGFNFGMGVLYDLFEARARSGFGGRLGLMEAAARSGIELARRDTGEIETDLWVDWESRASRFGQLLASSLSTSWFGIAMDRSGPSMRMGRTAIELLEARSRMGRVAQRATGRTAERFDRIHIDTDSGYVLDGELFDPRVSRTVVIERGPAIRFAVP